MTAGLQMVGPGVTCATASSLANSSRSTQRRRSTIARYANGSTPPNPDSAISENARKSSSGARRAGATAGGASPRPLGGSDMRLARYRTSSPAANQRDVASPHRLEDEN